MSEYLTCAETAALLRADLKRAFPGIKFRVRSSTYSGGSSIDVRWVDGPRRVVVEQVAKRYAGGSFDGMTDSMSYHPIEIDGQPRRTLTDFVFCERSVTDFDGKATAAGVMIRERCSYMPGTVASADRFGNFWIDDLARGMAHDCDPDGSLEGAFRRVVMRDDA
jgi:hypothetical protein